MAAEGDPVLGAGEAVSPPPPPQAARDRDLAPARVSAASFLNVRLVSSLNIEIHFLYDPTAHRAVESRSLRVWGR